MAQPNIIVICSDQHHPAASGYRGHRVVKTPHLDTLAAEGAYFTRAYCNSPVCTPSRMSFITGKYTHQIGSWFLGCPLDRDEMTWARRLHDAGIPSTMLGKMDFCGDYQDGGFTHHRIIKKRPAYQPYPRTTPLYSRLEGYVRKNKRERIEYAGIRPDTVQVEPRADGSEGYQNHVGFYDHDRTITEWAVDYIAQKGKEESDAPWALYVGYMFPHWPYTVPRAYYDLYDPAQIELPFDMHFPNGRLHPQVANMQRALQLEGITDDQIRNVICAYYGMISALDENIGRIMTALRDSGLYDQTYIVYTSDHGESLGEHGLFFKQCSYEGSVGVPLIVKGPDIPAGKRVDDPVSLVDLYPTIMDMAQLDSEPELPGKSWLPIVQEIADADKHKYVFSEYHGNFFKQDWYMITSRDYKYIYYVHDRPSLFHLKEDPHEMHDLALDSAYGPMLKQFEKILRDIVNPEEVSRQAKTDLGLIDEHGLDYTLAKTVSEVKAMVSRGELREEPEFPKWKEP